MELLRNFPFLDSGSTQRPRSAFLVPSRAIPRSLLLGLSVALSMSSLHGQSSRPADQLGAAQENRANHPILLAQAAAKPDTGKKDAATAAVTSATEEHKKLFAEARYPSAATCRTCRPRRCSSRARW